MSEYRLYVQLFARHLAWDLEKLKSDLFNIESLDILCTFGESVTICTHRRFNILIQMVEMWLYWNFDYVILVTYMSLYLIACLCQGSSCINIAVSITLCFISRYIFWIYRNKFITMHWFKIHWVVKVPYLGFNLQVNGVQSYIEGYFTLNTWNIYFLLGLTWFYLNSFIELLFSCTHNDSF